MRLTIAASRPQMDFSAINVIERGALAVNHRISFQSGVVYIFANSSLRSLALISGGRFARKSFFLSLGKVSRALQNVFERLSPTEVHFHVPFAHIFYNGTGST